MLKYLLLASACLIPAAFAQSTPSTVTPNTPVVFSNAQNNLTSQFLLGGFDPVADGWNLSHNSSTQHETVALIAGAKIPSNAGVFQGAAFDSYMLNQSGTVAGLAGQQQCVADAINGKCWAEVLISRYCSSSIVNTCSSSDGAREENGLEIDISPGTRSDSGFGILTTLNGTSSGLGIFNGAALHIQSSNGSVWGTGISTGDAQVSTAMRVGASCVGGNICSSQPIVLYAMDGGTLLSPRYHTGHLYEGGDGGMYFSSPYMHYLATNPLVAMYNTTDSRGAYASFSNTDTIAHTTTVFADYGAARGIWGSGYAATDFGLGAHSGVVWVGSTTASPTAGFGADGIILKGTAPTVTGTGTPSIASGSTDTAGEVTAGASATSVVIQFATTKANAPFCTVTSQTQLASFAYTISTTQITITQAATSGNKIDYSCWQH